jgi:nitroimidazol reductase NimA-like FMN-containing flavoprotein (pyridoxamine 5'-phosphate oxidase superfamily)
MLEEMKALAKKKDTCVLATVSGTRPHCSLMAYVTDEDCTEVYMVTHKDTHKFKNLMGNPYVSLLIDTREEDAGSRRFRAKALTMTGIFHRIDEDDKREDVRRRLVERHPHLQDFISQPDAEPIRIKLSSFLLLEGPVEAHFETV